MNLLCPSCQNPLSVPEQYAGQLMKCPLCGNNFTVPPLPKETPEPSLALPHEPDPQDFTPIDLSAPLPPPPAPPKPATATEADGGLYNMTDPPPAPPQPKAPMGRLPGAPAAGDAATIAPQPKAAPPARSAPPPAPPPPPTVAAGYTHARAVTVNPEVVPWVAPACLFLVLVLSFFPWVGNYFGGHGVVTQSAWGAAFGGYSVDDAYDLKEHWQDKPDAEKPGAGALMIMFLLLGLVPAVLIGAGAVALPHLKRRVQLPPGLVRVEPWRWMIVTAATVVALFFLVLQVVTSFSIEAKTRNAVAAKYAKDQGNTNSITLKQREIEEGQAMACAGLQRTVYLRMSLLLLALAAIGSATTHWIEHRGPGRPLPRFEVHW